MLTIENIEECAVVGQVQETTWAAICEFCIGRDLVEFESGIEALENEFREKYFSHREDAKTKSGKWKKTVKNPDTGERDYILPNAWQTSVSYARSALSEGVEVAGGQTALKKQVAVVKREKQPPITPSEHVQKKWKAFVRAFHINSDALSRDDIEVLEAGCRNILINYLEK